MKKFIVIGTLLLSTVLLAQDKNDLELLNAIPDSFQGVYTSMLTSTTGESGYKHATYIVGIVKSNGVWTRQIEHKPTAIYLINGSTLSIFFAEENRYWRIYKSGPNRCLLIVEDTQKQVEILRIIAGVQ